MNEQPSVVTTQLLHTDRASDTGAPFVFGKRAHEEATFQATVSGAGPVKATVLIEAQNDGIAWLTLGIIFLEGLDVVSDGFPAVKKPFGGVRARAIDVSDGATVTVTMGEWQEEPQTKKPPRP
jgi:hypothetical protein